MSDSLEERQAPVLAQDQDGELDLSPKPDDAARDRRLRFRLDAILMTYTALSYTLKFLDQSNYTYAYSSGMQEDLNLHGNELTWMGTIFSIGYVS